MIDPQYPSAVALALVAGAFQWWSWKRISQSNSTKAVIEVVRILVWVGLTFVIQLSLVTMGLFFLRKISGAYLALWGIVFLGVTTREILRLHRGTNQS